MEDPQTSATEEAHLERVLSSNYFRDWERGQQFLRYAFEKGRQGLKVSGKQIVFDAFHMKASDPGVDDAAKGTARSVRDNLSDFYKDEGRMEPLRIEIPKGSYKLRFSPRPPFESTPEPINPGKPFPRLAVLSSLSSLSLKFASTLYGALLQPGRFYVEKQDAPTKDALAFLIISTSAALIMSDSSSIAGFLRTTVNVVIFTASEILATIIALKVIGWILRRSFPLRQLFVVHAFFFGSLFLLGQCVMSLVEFAIGAAGIDLQGKGPQSLTYLFVERVSSLFDCQESESWQSCLVRLGLPPASTLIVIGCVLLILGIAQQYLWIAGVLGALRRTAHVGFLGATLMFVFYFASSTSIPFAREQYIRYGYEHHCLFDDLTTLPTLNPGPVKWSYGMTCGDFPLIDVGIHRTGHWSRSQSEHNSGIVARVGDELAVRLYLENGAADDADPRTAVARNVHLKYRIASASPNSHVFSAIVTADNAQTIASSDLNRGGDFIVRTSEPATFQYIPGTTSLTVNQEGARTRRLTVAANESESGGVTVDIPDILNGDLGLDDLPPGYGHALQVLFRVRVSSLSPGPFNQ